MSAQLRHPMSGAPTSSDADLLSQLAKLRASGERRNTLNRAHALVMGLMVQKAEAGDSAAASVLPMSDWATRRRYILSPLTQAMNYRLWLGDHSADMGTEGTL